MTKYIALLRGINVGGKRKILMADLKELFKNMGYSDISTYIQSGNVVFSSTKKESNVNLADKIEKAILKKFGFEVPVMVRTAQEFKSLLESNPYYKNASSDVDRLHLTLLKEEPALEAINKLKQVDVGDDEFEIVGSSVFLYSTKQYRDTKLGNNFFEKKLKVGATTRNWKTILKLVELSS
ncbi:DUF1697 domain-containing protein [Carboxylicivirga sp. N1Y90]|uniref:DUF1697 domain-containing protein n=1 Tax=Carboxylicivirga fragile TaxID=3417571 RepID=UPI003D358A51|nr:DUF1697 domain-containing protein [Marinilabiliaceae bacterium N1Y90]